MATTTRKLKVATKPTENVAYPVAYRVQDEHGNSMAMFSGLFGWGWSGSREAALLSAGVTEADVEAAE